MTGRDTNAQKEQLFFLQFDVQNHRQNKDVIVEIAGVRNNLSAKNHIYYNGNTTFTYVVKLEKRIKEILKSDEIDKSRLAQEVVIYADKCSVEEEITRMKSHIQQLRNLIEK